MAYSEGVNIYCPVDGRFSLFNSPYFAHRNFTGIDIYPNLNFGDVAPSPVSGEVMYVRRVGHFEYRGFEHSSADYVIVLRSLENSRRLIKILHVEPKVDVGDIVVAGDDIGVLIRSGFFDFWTDPHIHVEVREPSNPIRARGAYKIKRLIDVEDLCEEIVNQECLRGLVIKSKPEYSLITLNHDMEHGIPANIGDEIGLLDGGIPHYGFFGVHVSNKASPKIGEKIKFMGKTIGFVKAVYENMVLAENLKNVTFNLNGKQVRLSLYLFPSKPIVKIIPQKPGELTLERFEEIEINIG